MGNNLPSNPPFKIGDKVVCIKTVGSVYKKGQLYLVGTIHQCPSCGIWDVGCVLHGLENAIYFCNCGHRHLNVLPYLVCNAKNFAPYNPPRHTNVEIAEEILMLEVVEEKSDILKTEKVNN